MTIRIGNNTTVDPSTGVAEASTAEAQASTETAAILPDPVQQMSSGGDVLAELVALLTLASRSDRDAARKAERAEDMVRTQQEQQKVAKMREQADDIRGAAWASGLAEIGQAGCQIGGAFCTPVEGKFDWSDGFKVGDPAFKAGGDIVAGQFKAAEKLNSADAEEAGANADRAGRAAKEAGEDVDNARDALKKIASFYDQMLQAQTGTVNAALNWRA